MALASDGWEDAPELASQRGHRTRARCRLALMIFLSLLVHAATFYVFQVAYTPAGSLLPPPARVVLVPLDRPENASFARWLSLADPTLAVQSVSLPVGMTPDSPGLRYVPSYEVVPPAFKPLDAVSTPETVAAPPEPFAPGAVPMTDVLPVKTTAAPEHSAGSAESVRVILSDDIRGLAASPLPPVPFYSGAGIKPPEPTVFLIGVRPDGGEPFLFPVRNALAGGGSANADEADDVARNYLAHLIFHPTNAGMTWGQATFYWGTNPSPKIK